LLPIFPMPQLGCSQLAVRLDVAERNLLPAYGIPFTGGCADRVVGQCESAYNVAVIQSRSNESRVSEVNRDHFAYKRSCCCSCNRSASCVSANRDFSSEHVYIISGKSELLEIVSRGVRYSYSLSAVSIISYSGDTFNSRSGISRAGTICISISGS